MSRDSDNGSREGRDSGRPDKTKAIRCKAKLVWRDMSAQRNPPVINRSENWWNIVDGNID